MIKGKTADILISLYLVATLYVRIMAEPLLEGHPFISVALGLVMLAFVWALIKVRFLSPSYFGLLSSGRE
jgi:hypothetical protein